MSKAPRLPDIAQALQDYAWPEPPGGVPVADGAQQTDGGGLYRQPPCNIEAEQALLGAMLINNEVYFRVSQIIEWWHFFEPLHGRIYQQAESLIAAGRLANPVILAPMFENDPAMREVGTDYLAKLAGAAVTIINAPEYARIIFDTALRRGLIITGEDVVNLAYDEQADQNPASQIEIAEQRLYQLAETGQSESGFQSFETATAKAIQQAERAFQKDGHLSGIATGLSGLDRILGGLQQSDLIILAGRPGMGKTALACNIAFHVARHFATEKGPDGNDVLKDGGRVAFYSLEMGSEQLASRLLADRAKIPSNEIRQGRIDEYQFHELADAAAELARIPFYIDDTGGLPIASLVSRARRLKRQRGLDLIVVDYLQLVTPSAKRNSDSRVQEVSEITQALKALAKELNVPVIALSQLSRAVEQRPDKRPVLADLRESGSIEQDADVVLFVYREEYYKMLENPEPTLQPGMDQAEFKVMHDNWVDMMAAYHGKAQCIVAKHRHGPTGSIDLFFDARYTKFQDLQQADEQAA